MSLCLFLSCGKAGTPISRKPPSLASEHHSLHPIPLQHPKGRSRDSGPTCPDSQEKEPQPTDPSSPLPQSRRPLGGCPQPLPKADTPWSLQGVPPGRRGQGELLLQLPPYPPAPSLTDPLPAPELPPTSETLAGADWVGEARRVKGEGSCPRAGPLPQGWGVGSDSRGDRQRVEALLLRSVSRHRWADVAPAVGEGTEDPQRSAFVLKGARCCRQD